MEIDHVVPESAGGPTVTDNLCLTCVGCNGFKLAFQTGPDPKTGEQAPLFNPRVELRFPVQGALETVLFGDFGNIWRRATYPFDNSRFPLRASVGTGIRYQTPVGLPLALDYGINVTRHDYEDFGAKVSPRAWIGSGCDAPIRRRLLGLWRT